MTIRLSDGIREVSVEITGSPFNDPVAHAEQAAVRLYERTLAAAPKDRPAGFSDWALSTDTERTTPDECATEEEP